MYPIGASARTNEGRIRADQLSQPAGKKPQSPTRYFENTNAAKNTGTTKKTLATDVVTKSVTVFRRSAATTPSPTPSGIAHAAASSTSSSVTGKLWVITSVTSRLRKTIDGPKSNVNTCFTYTAYSTNHGSSK